MLWVSGAWVAKSCVYIDAVSLETNCRHPSQLAALSNQPLLSADVRWILLFVLNDIRRHKCEQLIIQLIFLHFLFLSGNLRQLCTFKIDQNRLVDLPPQIGKWVRGSLFLPLNIIIFSLHSVIGYWNGGDSLMNVVCLNHSHDCHLDCHKKLKIRLCLDLTWVVKKERN